MNLRTVINSAVKNKIGHQKKIQFLSVKSAFTKVGWKISAPPLETYSISKVEDNEHQTQDSVNENRLSEVRSHGEAKQWLLSHLPRLQKQDVEKYIESLLGDGFVYLYWSIWRKTTCISRRKRINGPWATSYKNTREVKIIQSHGSFHAESVLFSVIIYVSIKTSFNEWHNWLLVVTP